MAMQGSRRHGKQDSIMGGEDARQQEVEKCKAEGGEQCTAEGGEQCKAEVGEQCKTAGPELCNNAMQQDARRCKTAGGR
jgi:hypothetical protein